MCAVLSLGWCCILCRQHRPADEEAPLAWVGGEPAVRAGGTADSLESVLGPADTALRAPLFRSVVGTALFTLKEAVVLLLLLGTTSSFGWRLWIRGGPRESRQIVFISTKLDLILQYVLAQKTKQNSCWLVTKLTGALR